MQSACPEIAQWTVWDYHRVARGEMAGWVAEEAGRLAGFLVARRVSSDLEILNFAVREAERRRGIGAELLRVGAGMGAVVAHDARHIGSARVESRGVALLRAVQI